MNTNAMEDAIKRLMKYCGRANKEVTQSIERRKLVMDIEMIYFGSMEIMEQRDAALKLAEKWESDDYGTLFSDFSNELRAIFEPKE